VLGLLVLVETERERHFTPGEVDLVRGLGEQAAVAIRHARLFETQERQNKRLVTLLDTSRALAASLDTQKALARTRTEIAALLTLSSDDVALLVRTGDDRYLPYQVALDDSAGGGFDTEAAPGASGTTDNVADSSDDGLDDLERRAVEELTMVQQADSEGTRLVLPLRSRQGCEGLVAARRPDGDVVADDVLALAQILANQAAVAVENGRLYRQIERQATSDGLTGLYNHRYFYERLHQEFARAQRYGLPLSLLMLDIDDFKSFNDAYGHPVGDQVLVKVADVMRQQLRRNVDFAARYGGEEFAVLLPNTPAEGAQVVGDRLQRQLAALSHGARAVPPARLDGAFLVGERIRHSVEVTPLGESAGAQEVHVTVSCGIAAYPDTASGPDELVRNADKALYLAKRLGKNRVELFTVR
jgi:diguanylate cyclase (GGDEF)-like protein